MWCAALHIEVRDEIAVGSFFFAYMIEARRLGGKVVFVRKFYYSLRRAMSLKPRLPVERRVAWRIINSIVK